MPDFWISNGFVVIYDGKTLMRVEQSARMVEGGKAEERQSGI